LNYITEATEFQLCTTYSGTHQKFIPHRTCGSVCRQLHVRESQHQEFDVLKPVDKTSQPLNAAHTKAILCTAKDGKQWSTTSQVS